MKNLLKILKTKTFWINFFGLASMIVNDQVLCKLIPTEYLVIIISFVNIVNRYFTTKSLAEK